MTPPVLKRWKISHNRPIQYDIVETIGIFEKNNNTLLEGDNNEGKRRFVVVDQNIYDLHAFKIHNYFKEKEIIAKIIPLSSGEHNKSLINYIALLEALDTFPINRRNEPIIAIGGGVLTDIVGFVASTYRRGVPHIHVPTTLMGYIDAAIGIKTGINFNNNKNRIGTFACPQKVILDKTFLKTLDNRHILNGVGEILKLAIIKSVELFTLLENHGTTCIASKFQDTQSQLILEQAIDSILQELEPNLFEDNLNRSADFGHTFSTILEMQNGANLLHGEAVAIDCVFSSILAFNRQLLSQTELNRILNLASHLKLSLECDGMQADLLWASLTERSHHRNGFQRLPLPCGIGQHIFIDDLKFEEISSANYYFEQWTNKVKHEHKQY